MAYASVAQADHEAVYHDSRDLASHSPSFPEISSPPLSLGFDQFSGDDDPSTGRPVVPASVDVGSLLKSLSSSQSYEMVEGNDYEEPMPSSQGVSSKMKTSPSPPDDTITLPSEEPPMRTASISRHLPLNHPTPDLQSLQGAFVKNVERLEESAERLSMTSSLEDELNKTRRGQKRLERQSSAPATLDNVLHPALQRQYSAGSWSNSIIGLNQTARSGGYSPSGYITSPAGSIRSGPFCHQQHLERHSSKGSRRDHPLPEPPLEGRPLDFNSNRAPANILPEQEGLLASPVASNGPIQEDRPPTSASNDTYRQAQSAFNDFDGVHYHSGVFHERTASISRRISLQHPPLAKDAKAYREAQPGEKMIYYPAPVPAMLNLPQRLSKVDIAEREKRRLQALSGIPEDMRKSAGWLADQDNNKLQGQRSTLNLPPQLRASAFFEHPSVTQDLQLKNGSAVQTLDSILDAAAHAPVSAFTDHPIAGQLGKEVYGPHASPRKSTQLPDEKAKKRRSSLSTMFKTRRSSTGLSGSRVGRTKSKDSKDMLDGDGDATGDELDRAAAQSIAPDADEISDQEEDEGAARPSFSTAPTTLLAELQMRKEQQKQRNRTAADAFPNGMHSTLLELDAVAQLQQKARKTKHVTLAWEDHDDADRQNFDDEDIPLGVLFAEKDRANLPSAHRPIGLIERREMEENEPLSHRRARLRGEPLQPMKSETQSEVNETSRAPVIEDVPGLEPGVLPEREDETLAQRAARMKLGKGKGSGGQFAEEVASELGLNVGNNAPLPSKTPDDEETLAQRRKRLKEEALRNGRQVSGGSANDTGARAPTGSLHSLADILQAHPVGHQSRPAHPSSRTANRGYTQQNGGFINGSYGNLAQNNVSPYMNGTLGVSTPALYGAPLPMHMQQQMGAHSYGYGNQPYTQDPMMGPPLDPKQRAQIDRWRQGVVQ
ncbi:uncharacterized protein Z518_06070 [Rhinocladiella mackenziei CBS 650.93]|uniref:Rhinocladiella mackenziei CBS 650.93 unplaced genomic scaffold supercont1.4, whole genome shotgun sequence n=1 Tax=Rhinocladiella mackenziei CBS 650.93 TaxID=1442369 RepID=A0A0D2H459_9EURO|nr:uncharacterized protein Z518_06070 [Rhinocladiella mackenziei CBS 650.93]KIX05198.1 hypothetical protein Z518_06070 [Rhinocladiella mackenziei CBS 650.93]